MKFATAILTFSRRKGGAERYLVDLSTRMAEEGHEVHVYAEHWEEEAQGIHLYRVKTIPFPKSLRLWSFARKATEEIENGNYDIALGVGNTLKADILQPHGGVHWAWFWRSLRAYDNPILWVIKFFGRIFSPKQWVSGGIENAPYKGKILPKIIAISEMVKRDMMQWYKIPGEKITVVYNGVDVERFHPRNCQYREEIRKRHGLEDAIVILFVSNNFRMKGLGFLIKALAHLKKEGHPLCKLLILGRDRRDPYLRLAKGMGIFEQIVFAGSTDEPEKYYGAADLLVHPSFYDACSLTVLEALASGLPVITTSSNGASGIITPGQEGFVLSDPRDSQALAERISLFFNEGMRAKASIAARRLAETYSLERNWKEMKYIFEKIVSEGKAVL
ncbi:MAG: glycosyltransferase family 4 protein [Thermodesulfobacteriota bacterium]|nr:glycosyltransferase family 4 protein [Thermodesulfobacteriota bacterium]